MLLSHKVRVLKAVYHLEPYTKLVDIPPHLLKQNISRETIIRGAIISRHDKALVVELSGAKLAINSIE